MNVYGIMVAAFNRDAMRRWRVAVNEVLALERVAAWYEHWVATSLLLATIHAAAGMMHGTLRFRRLASRSSADLCW
jgi:hypothetical protein